MKNERLSTIIRLNNILSYLSISLDQIFEVAVRETGKLFPDFNCYFYLADGNRFILKAEKCNSQTNRCCCQVREHNISCPAVRDGLPIIVSDIHQDPGCKEFPDQGNAQSFVCIPLVLDKQILGLMVLTGSEVYHFSQEDLEIILSVANQTGLAVQRSRLFDTLAREKQELEKANRENLELNKQLEQKLAELKEYQEQLIKSAKLAATGEMAAALVHEINNPVSIIISRLECLLWEIEQGDEPDTLVSDLKTTIRHAEQIANTTRGLLSFARKPAERYRQFDLNSAIVETVNLLAKQLTKHNIEIVQQLAAGLPLMYGSPQRLQQVFVNLLTNARDAMPDGGIIDISTKLAGADQIELMIQDTGRGIPPEIIDSVFDPFFTTKEARKGTGLGLSIAYSIIKEHQGQIQVESVAGRGTTFLIRLPVCRKREDEDCQDERKDSRD